MSENTGQRLSKVAKELNVSISTITEFLKGKGHQIENNPMVKISHELYSLLAKEYQSEKAAKEEALQISTTSSLRTKKETVVLKEELPKEDLKNEFKEEVIVKDLQQPENVVADTNVSDINPTTDDSPKFKVKVVSKIDLDSLNTKTKPARKSKIEKTEDKEVKTLVSESSVVLDEVKEVESKLEVQQESEKPKEEKNIVSEVPKEDFHETKFEKLEGPKIMGKIELPVKDDKKKPVASSTSPVNPANSAKKKRKRIKKGFGGSTIGDTWTAGAESADKTSEKSSNFSKTSKSKNFKAELTPDEVQAQIKETLARLSGTGKSKASKHRRLKRDIISERIQETAEQEEAEKKILKVTEFVSANQLAQMMGVPVNEIISTCMSLGLFVSINQRLDAETLSIVAEEFGYQVKFVSVDVQESIKEEEDKPEELAPRPPIVTVMGHVDHGKTSLLDYIRKSNVIAGEAGGITQHIGAYNVGLENGKTITFLDTPGHEAFTAMRARGAQVTDIAIIVVSADDGVMPQTKEAINHAQAANVPIVIAINKIDKPDANPDRIREELSQLNILVEEWGGKVQCQPVSAKKGTNIELLLEKVLLEAELLDLKANPNKKAKGTVIESELDKGRGYVSTVLVESGTLKVGDIVLAGCYSGKVKALHNERGAIVKEAGPAMPVSLLGLSGAPQSGDKFNVMSDEREAREIAVKRLQLQREQGIRAHKHITLDEIGRRLAIGDFKELNVIVKGDVDGSVEALSDSLQKLSTEKVSVKIIHKSVGAISESDVLLASASNAIIIGFQVRPTAGARKIAETEEIDIRLYSIIYDAINEIKAAMEGMLAPEFEEKIVCNIEIRDVFNITKVGTIAGCYVLDGKVTRNTKVRIIRDGIVIHTGELGSLKRFKEDAKEVNKGFECGLNIKNFNDIQVGDIIEGYEMIEIKAKL
jgi:translation initiation factor IF-2